MGEFCRWFRALQEIGAPFLVILHTSLQLFVLLVVLVGEEVHEDGRILQLVVVSVRLVFIQLIQRRLHAEIDHDWEFEGEPELVEVIRGVGELVLVNDNSIDAQIGLNLYRLVLVYVR